ncbi:hypothetical protein AA13594_1798 [Gluconacetobacter azotocaptans DSM 13594]|nr:hypothetical protein AA13594_1798 [Gluconacetobacter azotocaptans DSM 13594]
MGNWLPCDGSAIPPQFTELCTLLNDRNTPNLIGRTLIGAGSFAAAQTTQTDLLDPNFTALSGDRASQVTALQIGDTGGEATHALTIGQLPSHTHTINNGNFGYHRRSFEGDSGADLPFEVNPSTKVGGTDESGKNEGHYNVQPYYAITYFILAG